MSDKIFEYGEIPLKRASIPVAEGVIPEAESGVNIARYQLGISELPPDTVLFGNITVDGLQKVLDSARNFICYSKFELGNDFGK